MTEKVCHFEGKRDPKVAYRTIELSEGGISH